MKFWLPIVAVLLFACDGPDPAKSSTGGTSAPAVAEPRGVPDAPPEKFGNLAVDVDRIVLTERTVLVLDDAGMPTGDDAHPAAYESPNREWVNRFVRAIGKSTPREAIASDCAPWADLTLYSREQAVASLAVDCGPERKFETFKVRGKSEAFVGADPESLRGLLDELSE